MRLIKNINVRLNFSNNFAQTAKNVQSQIKSLKKAVINKTNVDEFSKNLLTKSEKFKLWSLEARSSLNQIADYSDRIFGGLTRTATGIGLAAAGAVSVFTKKAISTYADYESSLANTSALLGIEKGSSAYKELDSAARETAKVTSKTASESAQALGYMALAGWSAKESMQNLSPMIKFAEAMQSELSSTSDIVTDSMAAYGMATNRLTEYLDVLTFSSTKANTTAIQTAEAMVGVGGVMNNLNASLPTTIALISSISSISKGSEAGNALNGIFLRFTKGSGEAKRGLDELGVSLYGSMGQTRNLLDVLEETSEKLSNLNESDRNRLSALIGGGDYTAEFNAIMKWAKINSKTGTSELRDFEKATEESKGVLQKYHDTIKGTLGYTSETIKSAWQELQIAAIEPNVEKIKGLGETVANILNENKDSIVKGFSYLLDQAIPIITKATELTASFFGNIDKYMPKIVFWAKTIFWITLGLKAFNGFVNIFNGGATLIKNLKGLRKGGENLATTLIGSKGVRAVGKTTGKVLTAGKLLGGAVIGSAIGFKLGEKTIADSSLNGVDKLRFYDAQSKDYSALTGYKNGNYIGLKNFTGVNTNRASTATDNKTQNVTVNLTIQGDVGADEKKITKVLNNASIELSKRLVLAIKNV